MRYEYDLTEHLYRQRAFSLEAFGPGPRTGMVIDHIRKELTEIESDPYDLEEWIDVILLALDGAWRCGIHQDRSEGFEPVSVAAALKKKLHRNMGREWPDWRAADPDRAIEHVEGSDPPEVPIEAIRAATNGHDQAVRVIFRLKEGMRVRLKTTDHPHYMKTGTVARDFGVDGWNVCVQLDGQDPSSAYRREVYWPAQHVEIIT